VELTANENKVFNYIKIIKLNDNKVDVVICDDGGKNKFVLTIIGKALNLTVESGINTGISTVLPTETDSDDENNTIPE